MVLVADPGEIRRIFAADDGQLHGGASSTVLEPFAGPTSILLTHGPEHLRRRRELLPAFHGEALAGWRGTVAAMAEAEIATDALREALDNGNVGHALLFVGPEGVGRRLAALALAASLNCPEGGCGECAVCTKVLRGAHHDVHLIVPEGQFILISQIKGGGGARGLIGEAYRSPIEGRTKVFIVEDAERMNASAANAMLKVLEEPPADVVFIMMTARPDDLLETIVSRCRRLDFSVLPEAAVRRVLVEHHGIEADTAEWAARIGGNLARALRLAHDPGAPGRYEAHRAIPARLADAGLGAAIVVAAELQAEAGDATARVRKRHADEIAEAAEAEGEIVRGRGAARGAAAIRKRMETRHKRELRRAELDVIQAALEDIAGELRERLAAAATAKRPRAAGAVIERIERIEWTRRVLDRNVSVPLALEALMADLAVELPGTAQ
jgi:DNA polymerase-3 subunit delta'